MKPLSSLLQFIFGCRHRHLSRVFTIKLRTYRVCFDCGREFDVPSVREPAPPRGRELRHVSYLAQTHPSAHVKMDS